MFKKLFCLLAVLALAGVANAGLVAAWNFNDGTGANIGSAGTDADGTLMNGATIASLGTDGWGTGSDIPGSRNYNGILVLDATQNPRQYMDCDGAGTGGWIYTTWPQVGEGQTNGKSWTVAAWFRVDNTTDTEAFTPDKQLQTIVGHGCESSNLLFSLQRRYRTPDVAITSSPFNNWGGMAGTSGSMDSCQWHHAVAVYEVVDAWTSSLKLYVDKVVEASISSWFSGNNNNPDMPIYVGGCPSAGTHLHPMHGAIDNVYLYDEALNSGQVSDLYDSQDDARYVPEPATIALLGLGGLALLRRKR